METLRNESHKECTRVHVCCIHWMSHPALIRSDPFRAHLCYLYLYLENVLYEPPPIILQGTRTSRGLGRPGDSLHCTPLQFQNVTVHTNICTGCPRYTTCSRVTGIHTCTRVSPHSHSPTNITVTVNAWVPHGTTPWYYPMVAHAFIKYCKKLQ